MLLTSGFSTLVYQIVWVRAVAGTNEERGGVVGTLYAAHIAGAVLGTLASHTWLAPPPTLNTLPANEALDEAPLPRAPVALLTTSRLVAMDWFVGHSCCPTRGVDRRRCSGTYRVFERARALVERARRSDTSTIHRDHITAVLVLDRSMHARGVTRSVSVVAFSETDGAPSRPSPYRCPRW